MLKQVYSLKELFPESYTPDIFSGKIKALALAYGFNYPFCRFFVQDGGGAIADYYGEGVLFAPENYSGGEELVPFLKATGMKSIIMSAKVCEKAGLQSAAKKSLIMAYCGENEQESPADLRADLPYERVFDILKDGFPLDFDSWYPDVCHFVRHGISKVYTIPGKATATVMFSLDGVSLISYVASAENERGKGYALALVSYIAAEEQKRGFKPYVICEKGLCRFYEKAGFALSGEAAII
ncbi:MAG: GNAT family N-acetyltransferase [Ruminiclostridium sp.]